MSRSVTFLPVLAFVIVAPLQAQIAPAAVNELRAKMRAGYGERVAVEQRGKGISIRLDTRSVTSAAYLTAIRIACVHLGSGAKQLSEVAILNVFGAQGYVFEKPAQCEAAGTGKLNDIAILAVTHQF